MKVGIWASLNPLLQACHGEDDDGAVPGDLHSRADPPSLVHACLAAERQDLETAGRFDEAVAEALAERPSV